MRYLLILALLGGCATGQVSYKKLGATQAEIDAANRECKYDVAKATNDTRYLFSAGDAISSGIMAGIKQNELMALCLESKGFTKRVASGN